MCADWHGVVVAVGSWGCASGSDCAEDCPRCDVVVSILEGQVWECPRAENLQVGMLDWPERPARCYSQGLGWVRRRRVESEALEHVKSEFAGWLTILARRGL